MINVAILGYGTVGSGVFEVLNENKESISRRAGQELHVKYVLDLRDFPGQPVEKVLVHDYEQIVSDPEVDIVVEVMGGVEPAYTFVKKALLAGKNVCTSNKALVAKHGRELMDIAKEKSINFLFEASCGGGIPIIRVINSSLTGDEIDEVTGILNGTTNYMLYKMSTEGCEFDTVLKEAQQKGYAEADPTADVEGYDACRKIAILSSLAYERYFDFEDIYTEGITKITPEDMEYAAKLGRTIKLLGTSRRLADGTCYAMVAPFMLGQNSPLYSVNDVFNAVFVHGNMLGDAMFYGSGAGKLPTASAVVGDIVDQRALATELCKTFRKHGTLRSGQAALHAAQNTGALQAEHQDPGDHSAHAGGDEEGDDVGIEGDVTGALAHQEDGHRVGAQAAQHAGAEHLTGHRGQQVLGLVVH